MCLILTAINEHPLYKLIIAANRDEFYARPTEAAHFWNEHAEMLAGKDLKEGGTWMGITQNGKLAAVTNFRTGLKESKNILSRGLLVKNFLLENENAEDYLSGIKANSNSYNGFNLLVGNQDDLFYYSNKGEEIKKLKQGIHGLSNSFIDVPWPKVEKAKNIFSDLLKEKQIDTNKIFELLHDTKKASFKNLPSTGIPKTLEKVLSSIFIKAARYGTRSSTILLINNDNEVTFIEKNFNDGKKETIQKFHFTITAR